MPGHAGGGHSGGFSGGGSHGGSGGGHSGSFGGSRSSSSFSSGGVRHTSSGFRGGSYYRRGRGSGGSGCTGVTGLLLFVPILLVAVVLMLGDNVVSYFRSGNDGYRTVETYEEVTDHLDGKDPLDPSLCTPIDTWMSSEIEGYLTAEDENTITGALQYFYQTTGVQPYFILTEEVEGEADPSYDVVDGYLYDAYLSLFGEDEGHYILMMVLDPVGGSYTTWYIPGLDAESVIDGDGSDILLTYIDTNAEKDLSPAQAVSEAFRQTADDLINGLDVTRTEVTRELVEDTDGRDFTKMIGSAAILLVLLGASAAALIVIYGRAHKKKRTIAAQTDYRIGEDPFPTQPAQPAQTQSYKPYPGDETPMNAAGRPATDYPVVCPNCGANAYPDENGCCQYCGVNLK